MRVRVTLAMALVLLPAAALAQPAPDSNPSPAAPDISVLPDTQVIGSTPLPGSGIGINKVPENARVLDSGDIAIDGTPDALRTLDEQIGGVSLDSSSGNSNQPDLFYHGFQASPLVGTPEGIAVYVNGARFNQPFGDTVNWDLLPSIAINTMTLEGSNPVFGLNALGGSLAVQMQNGFTYQGAEADMYGGSYGRLTAEGQYGKQVGNFATYLAITSTTDSGWRYDSSSQLEKIYGDIGYRSDRAEIHLNILGADNILNGPGTVPVQLLDAQRSAAFTSPNAVANKYAMINLNGTFQVTPATSVQTVLYYENLRQQVNNGNSPNFAPCGGASGGFLCESPGVPLTGLSGSPIPNYLNGGPYSELSNQTINTNGYGASIEATNKSNFLGMANQLVVGASYDGGQTNFQAQNYAGGLTLQNRNFIGPGIAINQANGSIVPVNLNDGNNYYGLFFSDSLSLSKKLTATLSGRENIAQISMVDMLGTALNGNHSYQHFNPAIGLTYDVTPHFNAYANYAVSNRAPTPAELSCADPASPCSLANFFVADPNLKQVVAETATVGLRGDFNPFDKAKLSWNLDAYRTTAADDILFVESQVQGRAYFQNIGNDLRQGVDAGLKLQTGRLQSWIDYSYTDATFQSPLVLNSPNNPGANAQGLIFVRPGSQMPGIPPQQLKLGTSYNVTEAWVIGATAIAASGQYLFGDEANLLPNTGAYFVTSLNSSYQITDHIQIFGMIENMFNANYYTYGALSQTSAVPIVQAPGASNPRALSPASPIITYGGIRVTF
jgi:outer membrane receptor protein involved in Fe transport